MEPDDFSPARKFASRHASELNLVPKRENFSISPKSLDDRSKTRPIPYVSIEIEEFSRLYRFLSLSSKGCRIGTEHRIEHELGPPHYFLCLPRLETGESFTRASKTWAYTGCRVISRGESSLRDLSEAELSAADFSAPDQRAEAALAFDPIFNQSMALYSRK